jgi:hypothetical protein
MQPCLYYFGEIQEATFQDSTFHVCQTRSWVQSLAIYHNQQLKSLLRTWQFVDRHVPWVGQCLWY